jgi:hypothetical protein
MLIEELTKALTWLFDFPDVSSLFSRRGCLVAIVLMLLISGLVWLIRMLVARWRGWRRRDKADDLALPGAAFYRRAVQLLGEAGLRREPAETPREFARRASLFLSGRNGGAVLADLPPDVTEEYYGLRFGRYEPVPDRISALERRLDVLEAEVRGKGSAGRA